MALGVHLPDIGAPVGILTLCNQKVRDEPLLTSLLAAEPCFWTFSLTELAASLYDLKLVGTMTAVQCKFNISGVFFLNGPNVGEGYLTLELACLRSRD